MDAGSDPDARPPRDAAPRDAQRDAYVAPWDSSAPDAAARPDGGDPVLCPSSAYDAGIRDGSAPVDGAAAPRLETFPTGECAGWPERPPTPPPAPQPWRTIWTSDARLQTEPHCGLAVGIDRVYSVEQRGIEVVARDIDSGEVRWSHELPYGHGPDPIDGLDDNTVLNLVATPDGDVVVATRHGELVCWDHNGNERWRLGESRTERREGAFCGHLYRVALGLGGMIFWARFDGELLAVTRCGEVAWRLELGGRSDDLAVLPDGTLVALAGMALFAVEPDGTAVAIRLLTGNSWRLRSHIDGSISVVDASGSLLSIAIDGTLRAGLDRTEAREVTRTEPFGVVSHYLEGFGPRIEWRIAGREVESTELTDEFATGTSGDGIRIGCDGILWSQSDGLDRIRGIAEVYPGVFLRHLEDPVIGAGFTAASLLPDGRLFTDAGLIQTDVVPGPGWSQMFANAMQSNSLAVQPE